MPPVNVLKMETKFKVVCEAKNFKIMLLAKQLKLCSFSIFESLSLGDYFNFTIFPLLCNKIMEHYLSYCIHHMKCLLPVLSKMCTRAEISDIWLITSKE